MDKGAIWKNVQLLTVRYRPPQVNFFWREVQGLRNRNITMLATLSSWISWLYRGFRWSYQSPRPGVLKYLATSLQHKGTHYTMCLAEKYWKPVTPGKWVGSFLPPSEWQSVAVPTEKNKSMVCVELWYYLTVLIGMIENEDKYYLHQHSFGILYAQSI